MPEAIATVATVRYRVQAGDSLWSIARDQLQNVNRWPEIAALNQLRPPYVIYPGELIELPAEAPVVVPADAAAATTRAPLAPLAWIAVGALALLALR